MKAFLLASSAMLLASTQTQAAESDDSWVSEVVVTADRGITADSASSATRTLTPIEEVPQSIQAITRVLIEEQDLRSVADVLTNVSGVAPSGLSELVLQSPKIRGFDAAYLQDGLPAYGLPASASDPGSLINIARVEVAKGPVSTLYGGGVGAPLSGVINLVSADPAQTFSGRAALRVGAYDTRGAEAAVTVPLGAVRIRLAADYETADSYLQAVNQERYAFFPTASLDLGEATRLILRGQHSRVEQLEYAGLPFDLIASPVDRYTFAGAPDAPPTVVENRALTATLSHQFSANWRGEISVRHFRNSFDEYGSFPFTGTPEFGTTYLFAAAFLPSRVRQTFATAVVSGDVDAGPLRHRLLAGLDLDRTNYDAGVAFGPLGFVDYAAPSTNLNFGTPPLPTDQQTDRMRSTAVFLQDQIGIGERLDITASVRWTRVTVDSLYTSGGIAFVDTDKTYHRLTPRIGATYRLGDGISAFAGYSEGFRGLVAAFGVDDPKPESSKSYEAGLKLSAPIPGLTGTLAAYQITRRNVITADPANPFGSIQAGEQRARGLEADLAYEPGPALSILGAFAYTNAKVTEDNTLPVGDRLTRVPKTSVRLAGRYRFQSDGLRGLEVGAGVTAVSSRELTLPNTRSIGGSVLFDAQAAYDFGWATLGVSIVNLTDADEFAPYQYLARPLVIPVQPRSAFVNLSKTF